jgi:hypothetical protein
MDLLGPDRYDMTFDTELSTRFEVRCSKGTTKFSGLSTRAKTPKIYIISRDGQPIYVGVTVQTMRKRLRLGFTADGRSGYHGYQWRRFFKSAVLDVWCPTQPDGLFTAKGAETIEAEIVYLIRHNGQWPAYQTEIHFHESSEVHRNIAARIMSHYGAPPSHLQ